ncbi:MAG TPA: PP2C family serine/threonine-protein phosphatase [Pyrinomonadaceae bacterium]|nr:PP2C family serine/threonine-protein phosphatase [Pyrinomonadaceae bacterium]
MSEQPATVDIQAAAISDRGLSEKRPLNEDSFLSDSQRGIFAVADGVGGAQAGEVASRTAMEVLDEAFRHQLEDADVEDLMEIAIQRANASIFQMSREHPKFSMMATTVVALHLDGRTATIGHVGDSRLYRVTPDGKIHRETADHSMVEEEVRAGRMTPEQAANHPSRNVISRALGAEDTVEVDLKIVEIEDATTFLLCSDGITRHIPDAELEAILNRAEPLEQICEEMKRRCYERGAEDNLTAVIINVGQRRIVQPAEEAGFDGARTIQFESVAPATTPASAPAVEAATVPTADAQAAPPQPPSRGVDRLMDTQQPPYAAIVPARDELARPPVAVAQKTGSGAGRTFGWMLALLILLGAVGAAAFYGGLKYQKQQQEEAEANATPSPTPVAQQPRQSDFELRLRDVDNDPAGQAQAMAAQANGAPLNSEDPKFLYLYGRALLLSGDYENAVAAFDRAVQFADAKGADPAFDYPWLRVESRMGLASAALKFDRLGPRTRAFNKLDEVIKPRAGAASSGKGTTAPAPSPPNSSGAP